jgi:malonyl-CoA/methylmalonyl-CoA synthetase
MSLLELFDPSLVGRANASALEFEDRSGATIALTFGDLESRSNRLAGTLRARGLSRGDRLAYFLLNRVEIIDLWLACTKLGIIAVPINVLYREREIRHIVSDAEPTAVIVSAEHAALFPDTVPCWDVDELSRDAGGRSDGRPPSACDASSPVALVYTSGTTGASKGAVLTQGNFASNARVLLASWRIDERDRFLCTLPLFHVHGLGNGVHCWLASGCHMKLVERFEAERAAGWFTSYRPTLFFGVPTMYVRLLDVPAATAGAIGERMRLFVSGSAPLPPSVLEAFAGRYGHTILERYGMTETLMNTSNPYDGERRAGTVGPALPGVGVRVRDESGDDVPDGTAGELWVQGPNVCDGYWRRDDATAGAFVDGWFRTGDVGVRAHDGYLTLQGRRSDLIISGGFNIYPREIEELLAEQPGVREAAVLGVADPVRGEIPVAYLVTDTSFDDASVERSLRSQLASFKVPRAFVRVDALPRTALGKVQKHLLPQWTPLPTPE